MQDVIVGAMVGVVTGLCLGPLLPVIGSWLARTSVMQLLLHVSVLALAVSSVFFPYSVDAPKRVVMQHTVLTTGIQTFSAIHCKLNKGIDFHIE